MVSDIELNFWVNIELGAYFIDRDSTHFRYILNYLRNYDPNNMFDVEIPLPESEEEREEILKEADYYQLQGLIFQLQGNFIYFSFFIFFSFSFFFFYLFYSYTFIFIFKFY